MEISIFTPVFQSDFLLQGCLESVLAQMDALWEKGVRLHHHVQDGGNDPETLDRLRSFEAHIQTVQPTGYRFTWTREPDEGMYDALNRCFSNTRGDLLGHLNTDEQYLPRALIVIADAFKAKPDMEVCTGGAVIVDPEGNYLSSRIPIPLRKGYIQRCQLPMFTSSTFYRRNTVEKLGTYFDATFQCAGDADFILRILDAGIQIHILKEYLSLFTFDGKNLSRSANAKKEQLRLLPEGVTAQPLSQKAHLLFHQLEKLLRGRYRPSPFSYTYRSAGDSRVIQVDRPQGRWKDAVSAEEEAAG
jgi:glycosyltransferase involved in cell wall biosynthesis